MMDMFTQTLRSSWETVPGFDVSRAVQSVTFSNAQILFLACVGDKDAWKIVSEQWLPDDQFWAFCISSGIVHNVR